MAGAHVHSARQQVHAISSGLSSTFRIARPGRAATRATGVHILAALPLGIHVPGAALTDIASHGRLDARAAADVSCRRAGATWRRWRRWWLHLLGALTPDQHIASV